MSSHQSLVVAAAQTAGPCAVGEESAWQARVRGPAIRTDRGDTDAGAAMIARVQALVGRRVLIYKACSPRTQG